MSLRITLKSIYQKKIHDIHVFSLISLTSYHFNADSDEINVLPHELNVEVSNMLSKNTTSVKNVVKSD